MNRKFFVFYFLFFIGVFSSCSKKEVGIPREVLKKEEMVPLLVDLHIAQAANTRNQLNDSARKESKDYAAPVFLLHGVSKEKYEGSISFYTKNPQLLDEIYEEVINELSRKQSEIERK